VTPPEPEITIATRADRGRVTGSLVAAFARDPVLRYLFPDEETYPEYAAVFFGHLFDNRVDKGTVWTIERGASVAIWEPPAVETESPDESLVDRLPAGALARVHAYTRRWCATRRHHFRAGVEGPCGRSVAAGWRS
jgi:hypothetical protein